MEWHIAKKLVIYDAVHLLNLTVNVAAHGQYGTIPDSFAWFMPDGIIVGNSEDKSAASERTLRRATALLINGLIAPVVGFVAGLIPRSFELLLQRASGGITFRFGVAPWLGV